MLSKKMTVSLMSLITILALVFVAPSAMAGEFDTTLSGSTVDAAGNIAGKDFVITIKFGKVVTLADVRAATITVTIVKSDFTTETIAVTGTSAVSDVGPVAQKDTNLSMVGNQFDGQTFMLTIPASKLPLTVTGDTPVAGATKIYVSIPKGIKTIPGNAGADTSKAAAKDFNLRSTAAPQDEAPKVVSIQRLRPGSQSVVAAFQEERVTGAFDVRIVLTEKHPALKDGLSAADIKKHIEIEKGEPSNLVVGVPFSRVGPSEDNGSVTDAQRAQTVKPHPLEGMYWHDNTGALERLARPTHADAATAANVNDLIPVPTGNDNKYHHYRVTITPHAIKGDAGKTFPVKIKVKNFNNGGSPTVYTYVSPGFDDSLPNGRDTLTVNVSYTAVNLKAGYRVTIPKEIHIPGGGYLIVAKNKEDSEVDTRGQDADRTKDAPRATFRTPAQLKYNVHQAADLPNLAQQFLNGVVVDVESGNKLYITEVMWGEDVSLDPASNSQWIELYNPGGGFNTPDDDASTPNVDERLTLVFYAPNELGSVPPKVAVAATATAPASMALPGRVTDRVGTLYGKGDYWSPSNVGSSGRSGKGEAESVVGRTTPTTVEIVSMYRKMVPDTSVGAAADAMMPADGQMAAGWASSKGPKSANFDPTALGERHGTPGAETGPVTGATDTPADTAAKAAADASQAQAAADAIANTGTYPMRGDGRVYISEIMVERGNGLPQWIEIANGDRSKTFNLSDWTLTIDNAAFKDANNAGASIKFTIPKGTMIAPSAQHDKPSTILVVTEAGRTNIDDGPGDMGADQIINLWESGQTELILAGVTQRRYALISDEAFEITLAPGVPAATKAPAGETAAAKTLRQAMEQQEADNRKKATDKVGNLGAAGTAAWLLPMGDGDGRSSILRTHIAVSAGPAEPNPGTEGDSWVSASETAFGTGVNKVAQHVKVQSYYGAMNDKGTPGFRAGGALPVELSHFRPARDKATGQVVITWSTQSELNNAGFFIKRSQQRNGEFKVINATMVPGAGTTSEKQFYTYTDTTAQPNVVYYYQIEDVSLDGNRQTLTRGIRLKGHVGAAGKATTLWGELKTSNE